MNIVLFYHSLLSDWNRHTCAHRVDELMTIIKTIKPGCKKVKFQESFERKTGYKETGTIHLTP